MQHMAGLAKTYEVFANIGIFSSFKKPKGLYVMHRKAFPDVFPAFGATTHLFFYDCGAGDKPAPAAICARPSNPIGSIWPFWFCFPTARYRAKASNPVLAGKPMLLLEAVSTVFARQGDTILPTWARLPPNIFGPKGIGRRLALSEFISYKMVLGCGIQKSLGLPRRAARCAAKSCSFLSVWFYKKRGAASFTIFLNHDGTISKSCDMGNGSTQMASYRQPDLFIEPPKKAEQTAIDFGEDSGQ